MCPSFTLTEFVAAERWAFTSYIHNKMKSFKNFWVPGLLMLLVLLGAGKTAAQPGPRVSSQVFYDELEPYGRWMPHERYGYVWLPDAGADFQPYATNGHWVMTDYGNTWVSDYAWGWAPFHYGRWFFDDHYGWSWVPDQEWGPAWVSWRNGGGYYGWAPLAPGMGLSSYDMPLNYWCFVPEIYIVRPRIITYFVPRPRVVVIYRDTRHLDNIYRYQNRNYVFGPRRNDIERVTRSRVDVYRIDHGDRPGRYQVQDRTVRMYRPEVYDNQQERSRPRNLADQNPGRERLDGQNGRNSSTSDGLRRSRSATLEKAPADLRQQSRTLPEYPQARPADNSIRNNPRGGRGDAATSRDPIGYREYPGRASTAPGQAPATTGTRAPQQPEARESRPSDPTGADLEPGRSRAGRGTTLRGEAPISRDGRAPSAETYSRRRESASGDREVTAPQPRRERAAEPTRATPGRGRQD
jgi:hypothetical protein